MRRVCAVIVTYNRPELLCRCVKRLFEQDYPIDILIYDNHSQTETEAALRSENLVTEKVFYYYADENTGGSGGFHNGMKMAREKGYDDLLLMDDDGYAINARTVSELMKARERVGEMAILNSLVVCDEKNLQLSFSLDRCYDGNEMRMRAVNGLLKEFVSPFNGTLISSAIVDLIGYPRKEFFVYGDETEYTLRAKKNNVELYTVVDSLYYHPTNVGGMKRVLGFNFSVSDVPMWKVYCSSRNTTYFTNLYFGKATVLKSILRSYINVVLCKRKKGMRLKYTTQGIRDGLRGDFSKKLDLTK